MAKKITKICFVCIALIGISYFFINSSFFNIKYIGVTGNKHYSSSDIIKLSGIEKDTNILKLNKTAAKGKVLTDKHIKAVSIDTILPNKVVIKITERNFVASLKINGSSYLIDDFGILADSANNFNEQLPSFNDIIFNRCVIGETLGVKNKKTFGDALKILAALKQNNADNTIFSASMKDDDVYLKAGQDIQIKFGGVSNLNYKVLFLKNILSDITKKGYVKGFLDLSVEHPVFTPKF